MIYELALTTYLATTTADIVSGVHARAVGAHEIMLPQSPVAQIAISSGIATLEFTATRYLWKNHHKALAIGILLGSSFGHGLAARHNWKLKRLE